jgi:hypothetical protein
MPDDETTQLLRAELERREQVEAERHQALLDAVAKRDAQPLSQGQANRTMAQGYAQTAAERDAKKAGAS